MPGNPDDHHDPDDINGKSFKTPQGTTLLCNVPLESIINAVHGLRTILWHVWNPTQTALSQVLHKEKSRPGKH